MSVPCALTHTSLLFLFKTYCLLPFHFCCLAELLYLFQVLEVLHNVNVNVASLNVARIREPLAASDASAKNEVVKALCFMSLDDDVPTNAMNALRSLSTLRNVSKIELR